MRGGCVSGLCCLAFLLSIGIRASPDLNSPDASNIEAVEDNITVSESESNVKQITIDKTDEFLSDQKLNNDNRANVFNQSLSKARSGYVEDDEIVQIAEAKNAQKNLESKTDFIAKLYSDHNQYNPVNQEVQSQTESPFSNDGYNSLKLPPGPVAEIVPYDFHGINDEYLYNKGIGVAPGHTQSLTQSEVPYDLGNIQLPIFMNSQTGSQEHKILENIPKPVSAGLTGPLNSNSGYESFNIKSLRPDYKSIQNKNNLEDINYQNYVHYPKKDPQSNSGYKLPSNQIDALVQAIIDDSSLVVSELSSIENQGKYSQDDLQNTQSYINEQNSYKSNSHQHFNLVENKGSTYYANVVPRIELIYLKQTPGVENLITCSREGEFHNLLTPSQQCLMCACVRESGEIQPVCASCDGCKRIEREPVLSDNWPKPPEKTPMPPSCAPLPTGITFEHPLNTCQLCMCYVINGNKTHISCQKDPQCTKPQLITLPPPTSDFPTPIATPHCQKFPEGVEFPHPTDNCMRCKCVRQDSPFGVQLYEMHCKSECEVTTPGQPYPSTKPNAFVPILRPQTSAPSFIRPTTATLPDTPITLIPINSYSITPDPDAPPNYIPISPSTIHKPSRVTSGGQPTVTPLKPIKDGPTKYYPPAVTIYPQPETSLSPYDTTELAKPKPFLAINPKHIVPHGAVTAAPEPLPSGAYTRPPPSTPGRDGPFTPGKVPTQSPSGTSFSPPSTTDEPLPWPPREDLLPQRQERGPLLGPPPHESCTPYPADTLFQHPWDECQVCRCIEFHSVGHTSIEVNCYTKASCCVEIPVPPKLVSDTTLTETPVPGQLQILDKVCEMKTFDVEFLDAGQCRVCICRALGQFVLPVCHPAPASQCAVQSVPTAEVIYLETKCRYYAPNQHFAVGCDVCACHVVFNYVVVTCTPQPNCDDQTIIGGNVQSGSGVIKHQNQGYNQGGGSSFQQANVGGLYGPRLALSPPEMKAVSNYMKINKQVPQLNTNYGTEPPTASSGQYAFQRSTASPNYRTKPENEITKTTTSQYVYSAPYNGHISYTTGTQGQTVYPTQYSSGYYDQASSRTDYTPHRSKPLVTSKMYTSKSGQEETTATEIVETTVESENSYPYVGETRSGAPEVSVSTTPMSASDSTEASIQRNTKKPGKAQLLSNATSPATHKDRGQCQYPGDMYHYRCQPCYCLTDEATGELYSVCTGNPCTS